MKRKTFLLLTAGAISFATASDAQSGPVTLKSTDGTIELAGELIGYEDDFYEIQTDLGNLRISTRLVYCEGAGCPQAVGVGAASLKIVGAENLVRTLLPLLITGYADTIGAEAETLVQGDGSTAISTIIGSQGFGEEIGSMALVSATSQFGLSSLLDKSADIAISARRITREEARELAKDGAGNMVDPASELVAALDSLAVIVHPGNPLNAITMDDLRKIYFGEITNWSQIGGPDMPIRVLKLVDGSASQDTFSNRISRLDAASLEGETVTSDTDMSIEVSSDPSAIGFVSLALQRQNKALDLIETCGIRQSASRFSTKTEEYPLVRRLYMYNRSTEENEQKRAFLDFVRSQEADTLIAKAGFVDLGMERVDLASAAESQRAYAKRLADPYLLDQTEKYLAEAAAWDRLSITFRFETGSTRLDAKAERDIDRLVSYLAASNPGAELAIVGFTDDDGPDSSNQALGEQRALSINKTLTERLEAAGIASTVQTLSYGELAPVACNDTAEGMANNRRVEIWIKS